MNTTDVTLPGAMKYFLLYSLTVHHMKRFSNNYSS